MVKKLNQEKNKKKDGEFITRLLKQNEAPIKIARKYGFSIQIVSYYRRKLKNNIVNKGTIKKKLSDEELEYITGLAKNKTTS